jgi:zinc transporter 5/7
MIFLSVLPLLKDSAMTLLLQTPSTVQFEILERILKLDNVVSYTDEHFWNLSSSTIVGTIHIQISNEGDEQRVTSQVSFLLSKIFLKRFSVRI